mgnify:CR=1 FL=1
MTDLVKSPCVGCRFAEWERTANGSGWPPKAGWCRWRPKIEPQPWWWSSDMIDTRKVIYEQDVDLDSRRATCDAREEA